jgi:hypothetical protein
MRTRLSFRSDLRCGRRPHVACGSSDDGSSTWGDIDNGNPSDVMFALRVVARKQRPERAWKRLRLRCEPRSSAGDLASAHEAMRNATKRELMSDRRRAARCGKYYSRITRDSRFKRHGNSVTQRSNRSCATRLHHDATPRSASWVRHNGPSPSQDAGGVKGHASDS